MACQAYCDKEIGEAEVLRNEASEKACNRCTERCFHGRHEIHMQTRMFHIAVEFIFYVVLFIHYIYIYIYIYICRLPLISLLCY